MSFSRAFLATVLLGGAVVLAACGGEDDLVLDNGLYEPPPVAPGTSGSAPPPSSSSSSSGSGSSSDPTPTGDGGSGGSSSSGGAPVEAACNPLASLLAPVEMPEFPAGAAWVRLTGDERTAYFTLPQSAGGPKIFAMTRGARSEPFANLVELGPSVNRTGGAWAPLPSDDDLKIEFVSENNHWRASRASRDQPFEPAVLVLPERLLLVTRETAADTMSILAMWERRVPPFSSQRHWTLYGGLDGNTVKIGGPALPLWYEASTKRLWIDSNGNGFQRTWTGSGWQDNGAQPFRVTWSSPSGCRLYGLADGKVKVQSRQP